MGVPKDANTATITKAFRKHAQQHHPDKGGDPEVYAQYSAAYDILKDDEKRKLYDLGGMEAVDRGHSGQGGDASDIFDFFPGGGRRGPRGPQTPRKGEPVVFPLSLTLEEMYNGTTKKLRLTRSVVCTPCKGQGGSEVVTCAQCQGRGVRVVVQRLGPGMITQSQQTCDRCRGQGKQIAPGKVCSSCQGQKIIKEKTQIDVRVPAGAREDQTEIFNDQGDHLPDQLPGDLVVQFKEAPGSAQNLLQRKGHHLFLNLTISLLEALTGFTHYITQLDGRQIKFVSNQVVKPGDVACIEHEGFQHSFGEGRGIDVGNMYITFDIKFPTTQEMSGKNMQQLAAILPKQSSLLSQPPKTNAAQKDKPQITEAMIKVVDMSAEQRKHKAEDSKFAQWLRTRQSSQQSGGYDDDDDDGPVMGMSGMGGAGCQPMWAPFHSLFRLVRIHNLGMN